MGIGIPKDYFQSTSKPHIVTDIELDETVNAIHDIEDDILAKMNGTTGHSHNASDGQGPKLAEATSIVFHDSTGHKHTGTGSDGTNIPWAGLNSAIKSDDNPADIATTPAPGTASKFSRSDHVHDHVSGLGTGLHHAEDHESRHDPGGADEHLHAATHQPGGGDQMLHASQHETGGGDLLAHDSIPGSGGEPHSDIDSAIRQVEALRIFLSETTADWSIDYENSPTHGRFNAPLYLSNYTSSGYAHFFWRVPSHAAGTFSIKFVFSTTSDSSCTTTFLRYLSAFKEGEAIPALANVENGTSTTIIVSSDQNKAMITTIWSGTGLEAGDFVHLALQCTDQSPLVGANFPFRSFTLEWTG